MTSSDPSCLVRTPLMPLDVLDDLSAGLKAASVAVASNDDRALEQALNDDMRTLRGRLAALLDRATVREALHVASPGLASRLVKWRESPNDKDGRKIEHAVVRYLGRMASRATPFGLFAAVTVGRLGTETMLRVLGEERRHVRLDMGILVRLSERFVSNPAIRRALAFRPNRALYRAGSELRYPALQTEGNRRAYRLVSVQRDDALETALGAAAGGALFDDIARALVADAVSLEEARAYVDTLIQDRILESELQPCLTGDDPLGTMVEVLGAAARRDTSGAAARVRDTLAQVRAEFGRLGRVPLGVSPAQYADALAPLHTFGVAADAPHLVQVDTSRAAQAVFAHDDVRALEVGIEALRVFSGRYDPLAKFVAAFAKRYEQREVPLMEALDEETGVGFVDDRYQPTLPTPLLSGLPMAGPVRADAPAWSEAVRLLVRRLERTWATGQQVLHLEPADWAPLAKDASPLPTSIAAMVTVLGPGPEGPAGSTRLHLKSIIGASAARLLGRFCYMSDELTESLRDHVREEEAHRPDAIFAEIVHLPVEPRMGNILFRPVLRRHEIPFCAHPGVDEAQTIALSDLLVSVRAGRVVLRSARLGREIVPRLSSAHNMGPNNLGVYRFLGMLQSQGTLPGAAWNWGPLREAAFLPRVQVGRVILSPRRWTLHEADLARLTSGGDAERFRAAVRMRAERGMPKVIALEDGDNILPVDLTNAMSVGAAVSVLKSRTSASFIETFCEPSDAHATGPDGRYANEWVVPIVRTPEGPKDVQPQVASERNPATLTRRFCPGSEWLFAKIYCSHRTVDEVLRTCVRPILASLRGRGIDDWFFIRYADPETHLRLRFRGAPANLLATVVPALERALASMLSAGAVSRWELATYEREVERYGGNEGMPLCEQLFGADSDAALSLIEALAGATERERWRWAVAGTHALLKDLGLGVEDRRRLLEIFRGRLLGEVGTGCTTEHAMGTRFRKERGALEKLLADGDERSAGVFATRSAALAPLVQRLREPGTLAGVSYDELVGSIVHMWNNRL
ncbi:MAG TPA: lantibiotic dehydratase, partial [Polyangiaceae bacterium]